LGDFHLLSVNVFFDTFLIRFCETVYNSCVHLCAIAVSNTVSTHPLTPTTPASSSPPESLQSAAHQDIEVRRALRRELQQRRLALNPEQQLLSATSIYDQLVRNVIFRKAKRIALYMPANAEVDTRGILDRALAEGKHCYLPTLSPLHAGKMYFVRVRPGQWLIPNRWGINEPALRTAEIVHPMALDLVLMPLLGFDANGNRLGMGMGFYDRAFAFRQALQRHRPFLLGLAHACQQVESIPAQHWDVPADNIMTGQGLACSHQPDC